MGFDQRYGYVTVRVGVDTHAVLKALAGIEGGNMITLIERLAFEEAKRKGFEIEVPENVRTTLRSRAEVVR